MIACRVTARVPHNLAPERVTGRLGKLRYGTVWWDKAGKASLGRVMRGMARPDEAGMARNGTFRPVEATAGYGRHLCFA